MQLAEMWQLLKMLFLGGSTLLTPQPIQVGHEWIQFTPNRPLNVITSGANLQIDISSHIPNSMNHIARLNQGEKLFPKGCAQARLISTNGKEVLLAIAGVSVSNTHTYLELSAEHGVPTDIEISRVLLRAECGVNRAMVYWHNFKE